MLAKFVFGAVSLALVGCVSNPPTNVHQPMTAKPTAPKPVVYADGAIFHAGANERPLFEDRRARNVGDILTINIVEKTTANRKASGSSSTSNTIDAATPTVTTGTGRLSKLLQKAFSLVQFTATGASGGSTSTAGAGAASEDMTGTLSVTVIEVLANGNLLVSGEKQVGINNSDEYIRFSGVVNPTTITAANTVQSTQVADARLEYRNAGALREVVNDAQSLGFLGRFFMSVLPF
jgi:flagellar L-ring protein precursor FlgH